MKSLLGFLACLLVLVAGCGEDTKRSVGPSAAAAKVATDDSSTPAAGDDSSTPATTPESVWASLKAGGKYTSAGSALAAFIMAAAAGDLAAVTSFVQAGVDKEGQSLVNVGGIGRVRTALHAAARGGHLAVVTYLVGPQPIAALLSPEGHVVQQLVDQGASISSLDANSATPLHAAVAGENLAVVKYLVGQGASVNAKDASGETPLHYAASYGNKAIVTYLLEQGSDVTIASNDGYTPAETADLLSHTEVKADLSRAARAKLDSLGIAYTGGKFIESVRYGNLAVVKLFVQSGMSIQTTGGYSRTVLDYAAWEGHLAIVQYLVENGADVNAKMDSGTTALHSATYFEHVFDAKGGERVYNAGLHETRNSGRLAVVQYLVGQGADAGATDNGGATALHWAAQYGHLAVVQYLVGQGVDVGATDNGGATALHWAASVLYGVWDHLAVVQYLVENGADVMARDNSGKTAFEWGVRNGSQPKVLNYLVGQMATSQQ